MGYMQKQIGPNHRLYHPINKEKFAGKEGYAVCRSSWEIAVCRWLDSNGAVLQWDSEPIGIPYIDPTMRKKRNYFPDFIAKIKNGRGSIDIWLIEVKPHKETVPPKRGNKKSNKTRIHEETTWARNSAKWAAAEHFCAAKRWKFKLLTEKHILA